MILGSLNKFKKQSPKELKPWSKDTRRTSGNTTRNDPFPPFLILEAQTQVTNGTDRCLPLSDHPTANLEDAFSSNFPNYVPPASPDYVLASLGKTYSSASNSFGIIPLASPDPVVVFPDDPYMKALHAFYTEKSPNPVPIILPLKTQ
ncbi:hypothetical protein Tco_0167589 [Tanacetum coccineum]